ncbi:hypothetical protein [Roseovarius albus]|uniref:hypothetical protein n=1 Tax=Roseovarius albus TaxID=1247867 RepID=UPI00135668EB|nr:hypothetical protein [Roseovarius albus]
MRECSESAYDIEISQLNGHTVLHSRATGAILITDGFGRDLIECVKDAPSESELLARLSHSGFFPTTEEDVLCRAVAALSEWQDVGLFATERYPYPEPVYDDGRDAPHMRTYASPHGCFVIETDDQKLADQLDEILGRYRAAKGVCTPTKRARCVSQNGGRRGVFLEGEAIWGRSTRDEARYFLVREAAEILCGADRVGSILHGSSVRGDTGALLFVGDSGHGKSTLAQGLVAAGCGFLADDHLPLHIDGRDLMAFPTGSAVKPGARELPEVKALVDCHGKEGSLRKGVSYLQIPAAGQIATRHIIRAIVMPKFFEGADLKVERVAPPEAFFECILSGARPSRQTASAAPLAKMCDKVPAYRLTFGSSDQSIPTCLDWLQQ